MPIDFTILREGKEFRAKADGANPFYIGRQVFYQGRVGLKNDHDKITRDFVFDPKDYRGVYGVWADFIAPTASVESNSSFVVLNSYDRAGFTFGFPQFAAHVANGDFVQFFRALLERAEAHQYFPNLVLRNGHIHSVEPLGDVELENQDSSQKLQRYLNQSDEIVDDREVIAAAKFVHWTMNHAGARELQVQHAVNVAQRLVQRVDRRVGLDGKPAPVCCVAFDLLHHGRGGGTVFPRIDAALKLANPLEELLRIGEDEYPQRCAGLRRQLKNNAALGGRTWSSAALDFV